MWGILVYHVSICQITVEKVDVFINDVGEINNYWRGGRSTLCNKHWNEFQRGQRSKCQKKNDYHKSTTRKHE